MQVQQLEAATEEALDTDSWADCLPLMPSVLTTEDAVELLSRVPAVQQLGSPPALSLVICVSMSCSEVYQILFAAPVCAGGGLPGSKRTVLDCCLMQHPGGGSWQRRAQPARRLQAASRSEEQRLTAA